MADKEIHHYSSGRDGGGSGMGAFLGIIVGAIVVIGALFLFANNWGSGDGGSQVTVNAPATPSTSGSGGSPAPSGGGSSAPSR